MWKKKVENEFNRDIIVNAYIKELNEFAKRKDNYDEISLQ